MREVKEEAEGEDAVSSSSQLARWILFGRETWRIFGRVFTTMTLKQICVAWYTRRCTFSTLLFRSNWMNLMKFLYSLANANLHQIFTTKILLSKVTIFHKAPQTLSQSKALSFFSGYWLLREDSVDDHLIAVVALITTLDILKNSWLFQRIKIPRFVNASVQTPNKLLRMVAEEICGQSARKPHAERDFKVTRWTILWWYCWLNALKKPMVREKIEGLVIFRNMQRSWELNLNKKRRGRWMLQQGKSCVTENLGLYDS